MSPDVIQIRRYKEHELDEAIRCHIENGYRLVSRGKHQVIYTHSERMFYWAKLERNIRLVR